jgi:hypothetical protein
VPDMQPTEATRRGRPTLPPEQRSTAKPRSMRLDDERWAKLQALGPAWLKKAIDEAKL